MSADSLGRRHQIGEVWIKILPDWCRNCNDEDRGGVQIGFFAQMIAWRYFLEFSLKLQLLLSPIFISAAIKVSYSVSKIILEVF